MSSLETPSGSPSPERSSQYGKVGPTIVWDITGLDGKAIANMIHLVYRFHAKGVQICESEKDNAKKQLRRSICPSLPNSTGQLSSSDMER